jgi:hypothetical protein
MNYTLSGIVPLYIVTEYPRSGGTWFSQMLSAYLQVPFPRNKFPYLRSSVMHGHYLYFPSMKNVCVILRDGRDVMVSYYFYSLFDHGRFNTKLVEITRKKIRFSNYEDIENNLPRFIEYTFMRNGYPRFTWSEFVKSWVNKNVVFVKYEDLAKDTPRELATAIKKTLKIEPDKNRLEEIAEKYSFRNQAKRNPGDENRLSFLRKGIPGDWKNYFTKETRALFRHFAGEELIRLGYEKDDSWV